MSLEKQLVLVEIPPGRMIRRGQDTPALVSSRHGGYETPNTFALHTTPKQ
jgi:hypothetical protein